MTTPNLTQTTQNQKQNTKPLAPDAATIRLWIQNLRAQHGDILNHWPDYARADFERLRRELMKLEASRYDR